MPRGPIYSRGESAMPIRVATTIALAFLWTTGALAQVDPLVEHFERFDSDPGWKALHNRIRASNPPTVEQNFGPTVHDGQPSLGGIIACSTTPATYGLKIEPLTLRDKFTAAGKLRVIRAPGRSAAYLGFYNSRRTGWRPSSALMIQFSGSQRGGERGKRGEAVQPWISSVTADWLADAAVTDVYLPADASEHRWRLSYDPNARINTTWPNEALRALFTRERHAWEELRAAAGSEFNDDSLRAALDQATEQGLLIYDPRGKTDYWEQVARAGEYLGCVTLQIDDSAPERLFLMPGHQDDATRFDRFGLVNQQTNGNPLELYVSDLAINGQPIEIARADDWEGLGNKVKFAETDFHARQDFGFSPTNHAGGGPGEAGGTLWRVEPVDPHFAYYAKPVGRLSLDDPLSFAGRVAFLDANPDSAMWIGYFREASVTQPLEDPRAGYPLDDTLGVTIDGPTRTGWHFSAFASPRRELYRLNEGPRFLPDGRVHTFRFEYDPAAQDNQGEIRLTLDGDTRALPLTADMRHAGATFDHFGMVTMRAGGKRVIVYFDDLRFTARKSASESNERFRDDAITVDYPPGGRRH